MRSCASAAPGGSPWRQSVAPSGVPLAAARAADLGAVVVRGRRVATASMRWQPSEAVRPQRGASGLADARHERSAVSQGTGYTKLTFNEYTREPARTPIYSRVAGAALPSRLEHRRLAPRGVGASPVRCSYVSPFESPAELREA